MAHAMFVGDPPAVTLREACAGDSLAVAEVNIRSWQESFPNRPLHTDEVSIEQRAGMFRRRFDATFYRMHVAEAHGRVVGFVDVGSPRNGRWNCDAELYAIYVLKAFQRHGLGRRLFDLACEAVVAADLRSMYLIALQDSSYRGFYERLGATQLAVRAAGVVPGQEAHVIYAWFDLPQRRCCDPP